MNDVRHGGASKDRYFQSRVKTAFAWIGGFATAVGLVVGIVALFDYATDWRQSLAANAPLLDITEHVEISGNSAPLDLMNLTAGRITIDGMKLKLPAGALWIANEIELLNGAVVHGSDFAMVAKTISGGRLDASGGNGIEPSASGQPGGTIAVAAANLTGIEIVAKGGNGADGRPGKDGQNGRNGDCAGFGAYRAATPGAPGEPGMPGGNGGSGGHVLLLVPKDSAVTAPVVLPGSPGHGGSGGLGGRGGRGCIGLGGSQPSTADGYPGPDGAAGKTAESGVFERRNLSYSRLRELVLENVETPSALRAALLG